MYNRTPVHRCAAHRLGQRAVPRLGGLVARPRHSGRERNGWPLVNGEENDAGSFARADRSVERAV